MKDIWIRIGACGHLMVWHELVITEKTVDVWSFRHCYSCLGSRGTQLDKQRREWGGTES